MTKASEAGGETEQNAQKKKSGEEERTEKTKKKEKIKKEDEKSKAKGRARSKKQSTKSPMQDGMALRDVPMNLCFSEANAFRGRYRVLMGGAGSGKSCNLAQDYLLKLMDSRHRGANLLVARKTLRSHRNSTFAELEAAARRICGEEIDRYLRIRRHPMEIRCLSTGNSILFAGFHDERARETVKSIQAAEGKICWIWCEEATELREADIELLDDRLRGALPDGLFYQMSLSFNPTNGAHWLRRRFFDAPGEEVFLHQSTYRDNRFIDADYAARMERRARDDPDGYRVYALGKWGEGDGAQILSHYEVAACDRNPKRYDAMAMGCDFGFHHPTAILLLGYRDDCVYVCDELILRGMDGEEIVNQMETRFDKQWLVWCDSAEPDRIRRMRARGWQARGVKKEKGSVRAQIDWLRGRRLVIDSRCMHTLGEIRQWQWKRDARSGELLDEPVNRDDDAMAALRYGIEGWRRGQRIDFE